MTVAAGYDAMPKCWNEQGFQVACGVTSAPTVATTAPALNQQPSEVLGAIAASTTKSDPHENSAPGSNLAMPIWCVMSLIAVAALL